MSTLADQSNRRRQLLLGAFTVLLHLVVFRWIAVHLGQPPAAAAARPPQRTRVAPPPMLPPPPLPDLAPEPVDVAMAPGTLNVAAPNPAGDGLPAPGMDGATAGTASTAGAGATPAAPPQPAPAPPPPPPPPPQQPAAPRYKIDLPPSADLKLDVVRLDANGTRWTGEETLSWTLGPDNTYTIRIEAGLSVMFARVNLLTVTSEGKLGDEGFVPTLMTEKRRGRALTATHFGRDTNLLTFSASQARYGLVPYAQDKASLTLELAAIARGDPQQLSQKLEFLVGEDRDASVFTFTVAGQENVQTRLGTVAAWHLVRPPKPGSYSSRLDLWLAPDYGWYPVQIRSVEASGASTTQTVTSIVTRK